MTFQHEKYASQDLRQDLKEYQSDFNDMEMLVAEKSDKILHLETHVKDLKLGEQQLVNSMAEKISMITELETKMVKNDSKEINDLTSELNQCQLECASLKENVNKLKQNVTESNEIVSELENKTLLLDSEKETIIEINKSLKQQQVQYLIAVEEKTQYLKNLEKNSSRSGDKCIEQGYAYKRIER